MGFEGIVLHADMVVGLCVKGGVWVEGGFGG
jgi:hypothetical protein